MLISSRSVNKYGHHRQFLFLIGWFIKVFSSETAWPNERKPGRRNLWKILSKKCTFCPDPLPKLCGNPEYFSYLEVKIFTLFIFNAFFFLQNDHLYKLLMNLKFVFIYFLYTAGNPHKQNSRFCKEIRADNFRFWWRRVQEDTSQGMYMSKIEICFYTCSNIAKSENAMLWRMLSRLETCIVYCCIWSVTLAKSIVPRKTWRKLWHSYISNLFLTKMQVKFSIFFHHGSLNVIGDKFRFVRSKLKSI